MAKSYSPRQPVIKALNGTPKMAKVKRAQVADSLSATQSEAVYMGKRRQTQRALKQSQMEDPVYG